MPEGPEIEFQAFEAGAVCWRAAVNQEDEDADLVGSNEGSSNGDIRSNPQ